MRRDVHYNIRMQNCLELPGEENKQANKYKKKFCGG